MEIGSELLLRVTQTLTWSAAYGNQDKFVEGTWQQNQNDIVLTAKPIGTPKNLFLVALLSAWDESAKTDQQLWHMATLREHALQRCPFMDIEIILPRQLFN